MPLPIHTFTDLYSFTTLVRPTALTSTLYSESQDAVNIRKNLLYYTHIFINIFRIFFKIFTTFLRFSLNEEK